MKSALFWMVVGSLITNAAWYFRARILAWFMRHDPLAAANEATQKKP